MNLGITAYLLKGSDWVVLDKTQVANVNECDFEEVTLFISPEKMVEISKIMKDSLSVSELDG